MKMLTVTQNYYHFSYTYQCYSDAASDKQKASRNNSSPVLSHLLSTYSLSRALLGPVLLFLRS